MAIMLAPQSSRLFRQRTLEVLCISLLPGVLLLWLLNHPRQNITIAAPTQHFLIVTIVSLIALAVAGVVTVAALQIQQYRVLFLALGFLSMGGLFAVHAAATPGFILSDSMPALAPGAAPSTASSGGYSGDYGYGSYTAPAPVNAATPPPAMAGMDVVDSTYGAAGSTGAGGQMNHAGTIVGLSAFLSLLVPALFFGASYTHMGKPFGRRITFRPAAFVVAVAAALALYTTLAFARSSVFVGNPLTLKPGSNIVALVSIVLFLVCAWRQFGSYRTTRAPLQAALIIAFLFLAQAQVSMVWAQVWTLGWWEYHVLMLGAVTISLTTLLYEYRQGRPVRRIIEGAMELQVEVGIELEHVEEIALLAAATEAQDPDTRGHTVRVAEVAVAIGRELNLPYENLRTLARAGLLHDVGKIGIPDEVLLKPGPLDDREWAIMQRHPQLGLDILERIGRLQREAEILITHHERMNGSGYPRGLVGDAIPLEARIIGVADTFDALVSDRPYRKAMPRAQALEILQQESGSHLYPPAVNAFLRIVDQGMLAQVVDGIYQRAGPSRAA